MTPELKALLDASTSKASKDALIYDMRIFEDWANEWSPNGYRIPATPEEVAEFIAAIGQSRAFSTVQRYVSSISRVHTHAGYPNPTRTDLVHKALRGLKRSKYNDPHQAPALSGKQLVQILRSLSQTEWAGQRNRAIFTIGWACGLRCSELHTLNLEDIELVSEDGPGIPISEGTCSCIVHVRRSKTDQEQKGVKLGIPISPLTAIIHRWVNMLTSLYLDVEGPLFPRFSKSSRDRFFPRHGKRERLSVRGISKMIHHVMLSNGLSGSVHSLRRGIITESARCGVEERIIQRHSRHASTAVLRSYIEEGDIFQDNPLPAVFSRLFRSPEDCQLVSR